MRTGGASRGGAASIDSMKTGWPDADRTAAVDTPAEHTQRMMVYGLVAPLNRHVVATVAQWQSGDMVDKIIVFAFIVEFSICSNSMFFFQQKKSYS